jgi:uncharacterized protein YraI
VTTVLHKPVVAVQQDSQIVGTLPSGTLIEFAQCLDQNGFIHVEYGGRRFLVFGEDLLDACSVDDAVRICSL